MEEETYLYLEGASGFRDRVPLSKLDWWKAKQEQLRAKGVSPERTQRLIAEASEKLKALMEEQKMQLSAQAQDDDP